MIYPLQMNSQPWSKCCVWYAAGYITVTEWCSSMEAATLLGLPWRMLRDKLVRLDADTGRVRFMDTFDGANADLMVREFTPLISPRCF